MAIPNNKNELINAIKTNYAKLTKELEIIPDHLTMEKELAGHSKNTLMSIDNLLAYLVGWGQLVLKWNDKKAKGQEVDFPETGYQWNELGQLAQKFYIDFEKEEFRVLQSKLENTTNQILNLISEKTDHELYGVAWYGKWTLGRMIQLNTSAPFKNAKGRLRKWKKIKGMK